MELDRADRARGRHVGAFTEVHPLPGVLPGGRAIERAVSVERKSRRLREGGRRARPCRSLPCRRRASWLPRAHHLAHEGLLGRDDLLHLGFDLREVFLVEGALGAVEVVVKAAVGGRAEGHLGAGKKPLHRVGHDVRRRVAHDEEPVGVAGAHRLHLGRVFRHVDWRVHVDQLPGDARADDRAVFGELGADDFAEGLLLAFGHGCEATAAGAYFGLPSNRAAPASQLRPIHPFPGPIVRATPLLAIAAGELEWVGRLEC